jgi:hypothetical protein
MKEKIERKLEVTGTELVVDIDYLNLVGSGELPRLTVELNLNLSDVTKLIQTCNIGQIGRSHQKYKITVEEV